jgi:hypothetical protein
MWAAVLIIAGGRPHYCDRPPVTKFYTLIGKKRLAMLLLSKIMLIFAEDMEKAMIPERDRLC